MAEELAIAVFRGKSLNFTNQSTSVSVSHGAHDYTNYKKIYGTYLEPAARAIGSSACVVLMKSWWGAGDYSVS